jgi:hypothetical protein
VISPGFIETPLSAELPLTPFLWPVDRAARHIVAGLDRRKREIVFPLPLRIAARVANLLPMALIDAVLTGVSERARNQGRAPGA